MRVCVSIFRCSENFLFFILNIKNCEQILLVNETRKSKNRERYIMENCIWKCPLNRPKTFCTDNSNFRVVIKITNLFRKKSLSFSPSPNKRTWFVFFPRQYWPFFFYTQIMDNCTENRQMYSPPSRVILKNSQFSMQCPGEIYISKN